MSGRVLCLSAAALAAFVYFKPAGTPQPPKPFTFSGLNHAQSVKLLELAANVGNEVVRNNGQQKIFGATDNLSTRFYQTSRANTGEQLFAHVTGRQHIIWMPRDFHGVPTEELKLNIIASGDNDGDVPMYNDQKAPIAKGHVVVREGVLDTPTVMIVADDIPVRGFGSAKLASTWISCTMKITHRKGDTPGGNLKCVTRGGSFDAYVPLG